MRPEFYYPAKPFVISQAWGIYNPAYLKFGFSRHNGIDFVFPKAKLLLCPIKNLEVYDTDFGDATGWRVKGNTVDVYDFPDGKKASLNIIFMHLDKKAAHPIGKILNVGDEIGVPDNTGYSTGEHTHMMVRRVHPVTLELLDKNDADNTIDPAQFWNGKYAVDVKIIGIQQQLVVLLESLIRLIQEKK